MVDVNPGSASEALRRQPVWAVNGLVATSHPLAAQAGLRVLQAGGNAVDAAIATAAALTVLEPCSNGLGSDAFAQVWTGGRLVGINGSGRAPMALDGSPRTEPILKLSAITENSSSKSGRRGLRWQNVRDRHFVAARCPP